jgi:hypothetical protein
MTLNDNTKITFGILTGEVINSVVFTIKLCNIYYRIIPDLRHFNDKRVLKKLIRFTTRM